MINKRLLGKLDSIRNGDYTPTDFIIADAKDGDMAFGIPAPGPVTGDDNGLQFKSRKVYLSNMSTMAESGLIDILLMSASSAETLHRESLFEKTDVTPAVRLNDTTDIWSARGSRYRETPSQPFATVSPDTASTLCSLGLYSITFYNDVNADLKTLLAYKEFRQQAREAGIKHFLEVFNPAYDINLNNAEPGDYINDMILKTLAGVTQEDAPLFLKMQFNGHRAMSDLASYDPENLIVGILGGAAGTTRDTFELAKQAESAGARVALFGRKINLSESPVELVRLMRAVIEEQISCEDAVNVYHEHLKENSIQASRTMQEDCEITDPVLKQ